MIDDENDPNSTTTDVLETRLARHRSFARHMACCNNGAKAARLAGFSERSAGNQAYRLLQDPDVIAMVAEERVLRAERLNVTEERIMNALSAMAFGDTREVVRWDDNGIALVSRSDDLSDDAASLVQGVERKERVDKDGNVTSTTVVKLADRKGAIDTLARIKGMFKDKLEVTGLDGFAARLARSNARKAQRKAQRKAEASAPAEVSDGGN